jgi:hypothetical protein
MIIGVTHDVDGRVVQRLSVSTKLAIGLPPNGNRNHPTKLDHFVFLRKNRTAKGVEWEPDPELTKQYGSDCREVRIMLIDDDIENIFPTSYAWWTEVERRCWGDGERATRRTPESRGGQPWKPCGNGCPELVSGQCKPSGDLRFMLADFPRLGSICRIHTSSYRSIRQIHSALQEIQSLTGGHLAGLTAKLVVRPEQTAYFDPKERRKKSTTIWALSLEVEGKDMRRLAANLTENARVFVETRRLLGEGRVLEVAEDEADQASELTPEFYTGADRTVSANNGHEVTNRADETASGAGFSEGTDAHDVPWDMASDEESSTASDTEGVPPAATPPWESEPEPAPAGQTAAASQGTGRSEQPLGEPVKVTDHPNAVGASGNATTTLRGIVGPLEPDASGSTVRRSERGVEYVVFKISTNGSAPTVLCNRADLLPEIARRQGRKGAVEVTVTGNNGRQYNVLERFLEG